MFMEEGDLDKIKKVIVALDKIDEFSTNELRKSYGL
jgi:hypothetical protein